jgi:hypothetical protein
LLFRSVALSQAVKKDRLVGKTPLRNIAEPFHAYAVEVGKPAQAKPIKSAVPK